MKRIIVLLILISAGCCTVSRQVISDKFYNDLASENNRVFGLLSMALPRRDLSGLTYDSYIGSLKENRMPASADLSEVIISADRHFFEASRRSFIIVLYFRDECKVVADVASTPLVDYVETPVSCKADPVLEEYKKKAGFK